MVTNKDELTLEESSSIIEECLGKDGTFVDYRNHRKQTGKMAKNFYSFTVKLLSPGFLNKLQAHSKVSQVYFSPAHAPPGGSWDSISLRYKVYIKYK